ncbi:HlyD family secretion protein [Balneicella halophila]|uniref:HlyD family secretion protein n=1 Tax=Balneicella halophila TaxID=1537566 RepID=A0A7L4URT2_BALHA|nr:HlyD family efflux transporter periplasmic adaptor subunit [Balneicella halophila]PVX51927.1 HlyD family secretion protein [Balneicella halophila]
MDNKTQHTEKSIELRSEKVRNIVGQIPSLLIRQGILIIGLALLILVGVSAFIPYKKTLPIEVTIQRVPAIEKIHASTNGILLIDSFPKMVKAEQVVGKLLQNDTLLPIKAPTEGKLIWNVQNNDKVKKGDLLCLVVPQVATSIYGECEVNASQKAMLNKGQKVELLDDFGQQINGQISQIYLIPTRSNLFNVRVEISYHSIIATSLKGKVILQEKSVLRYFSKLLM